MFNCFSVRQYWSSDDRDSFADLNADKYKDITSSVEGLNEKHVNSVIEIYIKDSTYAGAYKCTGSFQSGSCPTPATFESSVFTLSTIAPEATTQPESATIPAGEDHTLTCNFPNPYGDTVTPVVTWYFGNLAIVSSGKVYKDGMLTLESQVAISTTENQIETTLTLRSVSVHTCGKIRNY